LSRLGKFRMKLNAKEIQIFNYSNTKNIVNNYVDEYLSPIKT